MSFLLKIGKLYSIKKDTHIFFITSNNEVEVKSYRTHGDEILMYIGKRFLKYPNSDITKEFEEYAFLLGKNICIPNSYLSNYPWEYLKEIIIDEEKHKNKR